MIFASAPILCACKKYMQYLHKNIFICNINFKKFIFNATDKMEVTAQVLPHVCQEQENNEFKCENVTELPDEILVKIYNYLGNAEKSMFLNTCKDFRNIVKYNGVEKPSFLNMDDFYDSASLFKYALKNNDELGIDYSFNIAIKKPWFNVEILDYCCAQKKPPVVVEHYENALLTSNKPVCKRLIDIARVKCPFDTSIMELVRNNNLKMLKWILKTFETSDEWYCKTITRAAVREGNETVFCWLQETQDGKIKTHYSSLIDFLKSAAIGGSFLIFNIVLGHCESLASYDFYDRNHLMDNAVRGGNVEILKSCVSNGLSLEDSFVKIAIRNKKIDVLKYLFDFGIFEDDILYVFENGSVEIIKWTMEIIREYDIVQNITDQKRMLIARAIAECGYIELIDIARENNLLRPQYVEDIGAWARVDVKTPVEVKTPWGEKVILWLLQMNYHFTHSAFKFWMPKLGYMFVLKYFKQTLGTFKVDYPKVLNADYVNGAISGNQIDALKYLVKHGAKFSLEDYKNAAEYGRTKILFWMLDNISNLYEEDNLEVESTMFEITRKIHKVHFITCKALAAMYKYINAYRTRWQLLRIMAVRKHLWDEEIADICRKEGKEDVVALAKKCYDETIETKKRKMETSCFDEEVPHKRQKVEN